PGVRAALHPREQAGRAHGPGAALGHCPQAQLHGGGAAAALGGHRRGPARLRGETEAELEGALTSRRCRAETLTPQRGTVVTFRARAPWLPRPACAIAPRPGAWR